MSGSVVVVRVVVHAPSATSVTLVVFDHDDRVVERRAMRREGDEWIGEVADGTVYGIVADGDGPGFDASKVLLDPRALEVRFPAGHDRDLARRRGAPNEGCSPLAIARAPGGVRPRRWSTRAPVVYEAHVRGLTRRRARDEAGTFPALIDELARLARLGFSVIELLPVHQFDPAEPNYWGYQPLAFGAVHRQYAAGVDAAAELAEVVAAAHEHLIEVWLDVVFNHTTEEDEHGPTYTLRGLADDMYYARHSDGRYVDDSGCGNTIDVSSAPAQELIVWALDRFADLGVDGFRFDLATILARHPPFIDRLSEWASRRGVRMVAEPWDITTYMTGRSFPGRDWMQWNDRFRDDVRRFVRGDDGMVAALQLRLSGSPDLFDHPMRSVNYVTAHDGFTMYDLVAYDRKRNDANGHGGADGAAENWSWNCGWEGDDGVPDDVAGLRARQLRNAWCLVALAHGVPMAVAGDEIGRTQRGNNNAYRLDDETSWVDWGRAERFGDLERFVGRLLALRHRHPVLAQDDWWGDAITWFGTDAGPDVSHHSRSVAWCVGDLYVMVNAWSEPLELTVQAHGPWRRAVDTSRPPPDDIPDTPAPLDDARYRVAPRSVVVLER